MKTSVFNRNYYTCILLPLFVGFSISPWSSETTNYLDEILEVEVSKSSSHFRKTAFDPAKHGFQFTNDFRTQIDIAGLNGPTFGGLCGGMVYSSLDYFMSSMSIPKQTDRPQTGTALHTYIYDRQQTSTFTNLDKWTELFVNPFGWRTDEFFSWGLQGVKAGDRINELKNRIDKGQPVPIGLFKNGNGGAGPHHQVLAIGYEMGRYKGDGKTFITDFKIYIYDPNHPRKTMTLKANPDKKCYYYVESPGSEWLTYFVDGKYERQVPTVLSGNTASNDKLVRQLKMEFMTGGDDLRGGNDNINLVVKLKNGSTMKFDNINKGKRWIDNYKETVIITLTKPVPISDLQCAIISTTFGGGMGGDNWNLDNLRILAVEGTTPREVFYKSGSPLVRFTGSNKPYEANFR